MEKKLQDNARQALNLLYIPENWKILVKTGVPDPWFPESSPTPKSAQL